MRTGRIIGWYLDDPHSGYAGSNTGFRTVNRQNGVNNGSFNFSLMYPFE
jgi:hypothetical protein